MIFAWDTIIYLLEGCIISIFLFLIASVFIPALKRIRPYYLHNANIPFAILGVIMMGVSVFMQLVILEFGVNKDHPGPRGLSTKITLITLLLLGIVPALAFSRKRNTTVWFTCLLLVSVSMIVHAMDIMQWLLNITGIDEHHYYQQYGPDAIWYQIAAAILIFVVPYWFARRKINRA